MASFASICDRFGWTLRGRNDVPHANVRVTFVVTFVVKELAPAIMAALVTSLRPAHRITPAFDS